MSKGKKAAIALLILALAMLLLASCQPAGGNAGDGQGDGGNTGTGTGTAPSWLDGKWSGRVKISGSDIDTTYENVTMEFRDGELENLSGLDYDSNISVSYTSSACTIKASGSQTVGGVRTTYNATYKITKGSGNSCDFDGKVTGRSSFNGQSYSTTINIEGTLRK